MQEREGKYIAGSEEVIATRREKRASSPLVEQNFRGRDGSWRTEVKGPGCERVRRTRAEKEQKERTEGRDADPLLIVL